MTPILDQDGITADVLLNDTRALKLVNNYKSVDCGAITRKVTGRFCGAKNTNL